MVLAQEQAVYQEEYYHADHAPGPRAAAKRTVSPAKPVLVTLVMLAFVAGIFLTSQYARLAMLGNEVNQIKADINSLKNENERLQLKIAQLKTPERVEIIAVSKLGMQSPTMRQFKLVSPPPQAHAENMRLAESTDEKFEPDTAQAGFIQAFTEVISGWVKTVQPVEASQL